MRKFLKIVAEQTAGRWMAWFEDAPQVASGGKFPFEAIDRLLERYGADHFDAQEIIAGESAIGPDHREYLIPLRHYIQIPSPSVN